MNFVAAAGARMTPNVVNAAMLSLYPKQLKTFQITVSTDRSE